VASLILIVDDDTVTREGLQAVLENNDYQIETATNGVEAIQKAQTLLPDLILLDVMMPEMDGYEVCHTIRGIPEIAEIPIILLTALDSQESFLHGLEMGADDFLTKPINRHELRARVKTITRLNRYRSLVTERARIRELTSQIINLQEEERHRIAQELHDEVGQALATLSIGLKLLRDEPGCDPIMARIDDLRELTQTVMSQLRLISHDLRPPALDTLGLEPTLAGFCQDFSRRTQLPTLFFKEGAIPPLSEEVNISLYRILQEALTNILKHANASQIWIKLKGEANSVHLTILDDGKGFPQAPAGRGTDVLKLTAGNAGIGLFGMQERVSRLNGTLEIETQPGQGTQISVWVPIQTAGDQ
jgi:signal transduction histidine kinase